MVTITHSKIKSKNKDKKGQWYPKLYIKSSNWQKAKRPYCKEILFYYRADTTEKKKQNKESTIALKEVKKFYEERYKGAEYRDDFESSITLKNHLDRMIRLNEGYSPSQTQTYRNLKSSLEDFCVAYNHNINMDINRVDLIFCDDFRAWLVNDAKSKKTGKGYKGDTVYKYFSSFGSALRKAEESKQMFSNPFNAKIAYPKKSETEIEFLTAEEVKKLRSSYDGFDLLKNAFLFMCHTGIRQGDCRNLKWKDLPIIDGEIKMKVRTQKAKTDIYFKIRWIARDLLPERKGDDDKVFPDLNFSHKNNMKLREWTLMNDIKKHVTPHIARHSFSAFMLSKGTPLYTLSKILGHTNARTTEERYGHLSNEDIETAMEKVWGGYQSAWIK